MLRNAKQVVSLFDCPANSWRPGSQIPGCPIVRDDQNSGRTTNYVHCGRPSDDQLINTSKDIYTKSMKLGNLSFHNVFLQVETYFVMRAGSAFYLILFGWNSLYHMWWDELPASNRKWFLRKNWNEMEWQVSWISRSTVLRNITHCSWRAAGPS